jgi:hypothetical protein
VVFLVADGGADGAGVAGGGANEVCVCARLQEEEEEAGRQLLGSRRVACWCFGRFRRDFLFSFLYVENSKSKCKSKSVSVAGTRGFY